MGCIALSVSAFCMSASILQTVGGVIDWHGEPNLAVVEDRTVHDLVRIIDANHTRKQSLSL